MLNIQDVLLQEAIRQRDALTAWILVVEAVMKKSAPPTTKKKKSTKPVKRPRTARVKSAAYQEKADRLVDGAARRYAIITALEEARIRPVLRDGVDTGIAFDGLNTAELRAAVAKRLRMKPAIVTDSTFKVAITNACQVLTRHGYITRAPDGFWVRTTKSFG